MPENTLRVKYYIDPSTEGNNVKVINEITDAMQMELNGDCITVAVDSSQRMQIESDVIPVLVVHRSWWEDIDESNKISALNTYCKKGRRYTLLIVFTGGFDMCRDGTQYPGHDEWRKKYVGSDFPKKQFCILCNKDFVEVIPQMARYLRETRLEKWQVDGFWKEPVPPTCLTALSLLCQGFLAVQCGPDGKAKDGFTVEVPDTKGKIVDALREMKWGEVILSDGLKCSLDPRLSVAERTGRDALRIEVSSPGFWAVFDETDTTKLADAIGREWEALCGGNKFNDSCTHRIIEALPLKAGARVDGDFPTLVAEAYIELAGRLGRTE